MASTGGRWLICVVAWRQAPGYPPVEFWIEDDARNWWEPMGAPGGSTPAAGDIRIAVWRAPAARPAKLVSAAPSGFVLSTAVTVTEVDGALPWVAETPTLTVFQASGTSLPPLTSAGSGNAVWITAMARDLNTVTTTVPPGWTPGPMASAGDGLDHSSDLTLMTAFQQTSGGVSATWSGSASCGMAGIVTGFATGAPAPVQLNANWPVTSFAIDPGAGQGTPPSQITWTDVDTPPASPMPRFFDFNLTQGQEYEVGSLQAGEGNVTLGDPDLGLLPTTATAFEGVDSGTPWRLLLALPALASPWYVIRGLFERLPQSWDSETWYGWVKATILDSWAYCQAQMQSCLRSEYLADYPYAYWPLGDPAGAVYASNLAPGNTNALVQVTSPYGPGSATAAFGATAVLSTAEAAVATTTGGLPGDGGTVWQQSGLPAAVTTEGFVLYCQDPGFPALSGANGFSLETWHALTDTTLGQDVTLQAIKNVRGLVWRVWADIDGALWITTQDITGAQVTTQLSTASWLNAGLFQVAIAWNAATGWAAYLNGAKAASSASVPNLAPQFSWLEVAGESDRFGTGMCYNGQAAHVGVFPQALPASRIAAHFQAGATGMVREPMPSRIERVLSYGGYTGRRLIETSATVDECASLSDLGTTTATAGTGTQGAPIPAGQGTVQAGQEIAALISSTTPAMVYVPPTGSIYFHAKGNTFGESPKWVLGDEPSLGEIPFEDDMATDWDPQRVINLPQITQLDRQDVVIPQALSPNAAGMLTTAQSQVKYGQQTDQITGYLNNDVTTAISQANPSSLIDLANWLATSYAAPHLRIQQITVNAEANPSAFPFVLGVSPGDVATVNHRPPQAAPAMISLTARIMQVNRTLAWGGKEPHPVAKVTLILDFCPELNPLTLGDPILGLLSGTPVLTW